MELLFLKNYDLREKTMLNLEDDEKWKGKSTEQGKGEVRQDKQEGSWEVQNQFLASQLPICSFALVSQAVEFRFLDPD